MNIDPNRSTEANEFAGKHALVTGGTKGMGEAIAQRLARGGAAVITAARSAAGAPASDLVIQADLSTAQGTEKVVREVLDRFGGVDILINNVGGSTAPGGGFAALTDDDSRLALNGSEYVIDGGTIPTV